MSSFMQTSFCKNKSIIQLVIKGFLCLDEYEFQSSLLIHTDTTFIQESLVILALLKINWFKFFNLMNEFEI